MEDITDAGYVYTKNVCKDFDKSNLSEYYDLHVQSDTLLLADVFWEILKYVSLNIRIRPFSFSYCTWISMVSSLKKVKVILDLLTHFDM